MTPPDPSIYHMLLVVHAYTKFHTYPHSFQELPRGSQVTTHDNHAAISCICTYPNEHILQTFLDSTIIFSSQLGALIITMCFTKHIINFLDSSSRIPSTYMPDLAYSNSTLLYSIINSQHKFSISKDVFRNSSIWMLSSQ